MRQKSRFFYFSFYVILEMDRFKQNKGVKRSMKENGESNFSDFPLATKRLSFLIEKRIENPNITIPLSQKDEIDILSKFLTLRQDGFGFEEAIALMAGGFITDLDTMQSRVIFLREIVFEILEKCARAYIVVI